MAPPSPASRRHRSRHRHHLQCRHEKDELSAIPPRIVNLLSAQLPHPPTVAILAPAVLRPSPRHECPLDPFLRQHLLLPDAPAIAVELSERPHLPRRHLHVVAAEVDAFRVARPARQLETQRPRQHFLCERPRAFARRLRQNRREQMGVPGRVDHAPARPLDQLPLQRVPHPAPARYPGSVVPAAGRLETRPHRHQVLDGDRALGRTLGQILRKVAADRGSEPRNQLPLDRNAD